MMIAEEREVGMDKMEWAVWGLKFLADARRATEEEFRGAMGEIRGYPGAHRDSWFGASKDIISNLYHFSVDFVASIQIPSAKFASPDVFEIELTNYRAFVQKMADELDHEDAEYRKANKGNRPPILVDEARGVVFQVVGALDYVISKKPTPTVAPQDPVEVDVNLVANLARRFHESVLSLAVHPHNGTELTVSDEWDSQYLFRAILAAYFPDIRDEEWNPSVAGSSTRCEFFLKPLRTMVELKYVRKAGDAKKIKTELAGDLLDYGSNPQVDRVIFLIYDPGAKLKAPVPLQTDLSGPRTGLARVDVVVSPPRD